MSIALTSQQAAGLLEQFQRLCRGPQAEARQLEEVAEKLRNGGYRQELGRVLREALSWPDANPHLGALWIRRLVVSNSWDRTYPVELDELCRRGDIGRRAVIAFLEAAAVKRRLALVQQVHRKHGRWLKTHPEGWIAMAQALGHVHLYRKLRRWTSGAKRREDLDSTGLYCVALGLRGTGSEAAAHQIVLRALSQPEAASRVPMLLLWQAMEEALAGETRSAATHLKQVNVVGWDDDSLLSYHLTRSVMRVQQAERAERKEAFQIGYERMRERFRKRPVYKRHILLRQEYRRCLWRMAKDSGRWGPGILALWQSASTWRLLLPLLLIPGLQLFAPLYLLRLCIRRTGPVRN